MVRTAEAGAVSDKNARQPRRTALLAAALDGVLWLSIVARDERDYLQTSLDSTCSALQPTFLLCSMLPAFRAMSETLEPSVQRRQRRVAMGSLIVLLTMTGLSLFHLFGSAEKRVSYHSASFPGLVTFRGGRVTIDVTLRSGVPYLTDAAGAWEAVFLESLGGGNVYYICKATATNEFLYIDNARVPLGRVDVLLRHEAELPRGLRYEKQVLRNAEVITFSEAEPFYVSVSSGSGLTDLRVEGLYDSARVYRYYFVGFPKVRRDSVRVEVTRPSRSALVYFTLGFHQSLQTGMCKGSNSIVVAFDSANVRMSFPFTRSGTIVGGTRSAWIGGGLLPKSRIERSSATGFQRIDFRGLDGTIRVGTDSIIFDTLQDLSAESSGNGSFWYSNGGVSYSDRVGNLSIQGEPQIEPRWKGIPGEILAVLLTGVIAGVAYLLKVLLRL